MAVPSQKIGTPIPENTPHAVSVTLPTWDSVVGYEEGDQTVMSLLQTGYPRFFIHNAIKALCSILEAKYGRDGELAMVFPLYGAAKRCREFIRKRSEERVRVLQLATPPPANDFQKSSVVEATVGVVFFASKDFPVAKQYWQHAGEGVSSRMAEYVAKTLAGDGVSGARGKQEWQAQQIQRKLPSIGAAIRQHSGNEEAEREFNTFIEQKYGRVLDLKFAAEAKAALRRRIAGKADKAASEAEEMAGKRGKLIAETDVYLFPTGMAALFCAHRAVLAVAGEKKSVCYGFPYTDTLSVLRKFGPGVRFFGLGNDADLDTLETELLEGASFAALFCECPSNPLLRTPDLPRIRRLADQYGFLVVIDETVGNFLNIHTLPFGDMVAASLTKIFSGESNVMGGSLAVNPLLKHYHAIKEFFADNFEDLLWPEDALYLERNSRDFALRSARVDENTLKVVALMDASTVVEKVYYPTLCETRPHYEALRRSEGGYGGLVSFLFRTLVGAQAFYDSLQLHKGPSLGTNFTLGCPYAVLVHYNEMEEVAQYGIDERLIRISVGLEDVNELLAVFQKSLDAAKEAGGK